MARPSAACPGDGEAQVDHRAFAVASRAEPRGPLITSARWNQIQHELEVVIALEPVERAAYLDNLAATDPGLREEIDSLLAQESATGFLKTSSAFSLSEESVGHNPMIGRRLGPY